MKSILYFFLSFLFFASCQSQNKNTLNIIKFKLIKKSKLIPKNGIKPFPSSYRNINDSIYITFNSDNKKKLITYNLTSKKITEIIPINYFDNQNLSAFNYHNKDSIFLAFNASAISRNQFHDSSVMIINNHGKISKIFDFKNSHVFCSYNPFSTIDSSVILPTPFSEISYSNNNLYFGFLKRNYKIGYSKSENIKLPIAGHYNLSKNKLIEYNNLKEIPFFKEGRYYHKLNKIIQIILSNDNLPIIAFGHTSLIYKYDTKQKKKYSYKIKSILVDTVKPNNKCKTGKCKDYYNAFYSKIYYNKYLKQYYRFISLPSLKDDTPYRKNHRKKTLVITDINFNTIAEGIIPDNLVDVPFIISKEGLWFYNSSDNENITFELYTINYKKGSKQDLINEYHKKTDVDNKFGISPFMKDNFNIKEKNAAIIIVPTDLGCHSCASTISKFYIDNQNLFKGKKIYFVLAGLAKFSVEPFIKQNNIELNMPNLLIDKKGKYLNYFDSFNNPKLFILENGKIKFKKVFYPSELIDLELKIKEYSGK